MLPAKGYYFFYFAAGASMGSYLPIFYQGNGLSGNQIGMVTALGALIIMLAAPIWGALADATRRHKQLLMLSLIGAALAAQGIYRTHTFAGFLAIVTVSGFFGAPNMGLMDHTTMSLLGERRAEYGRTRQWGTLGWMVSAPLAGLLIDRNGLGWAFGLYTALLLIAVTSVGLVRPQGAGMKMETNIFKGISLVWRDSRWFLFIFSTLVAGIGQAIIYYYLFLTLQGKGFSKAFMGMTNVFSTGGELPVMFFGAWLVRRFGSRALITASMVATAVRAMAYSYTDTGWVILAIQLLHGPSFGFLWIGGVARAFELAPPGMTATAQCLFSSVAMGVGGVLAALFGGTLYQAVGATMMFRFAGILVFAGLLVRLLAERLIEAHRRAHG